MASYIENAKENMQDNKFNLMGKLHIGQTGNNLSWLSMDSENGERISENLFIKPSELLGEGSLSLSVESKGDALLLTIENCGTSAVNNPGISLFFDPLITAAVLLPAALGNGSETLPPWMLLAPDYGYARIEPLQDGWTARITGKRGGGTPIDTPRHEGISPALRGDDWIRAAELKTYTRGELNIIFTFKGSLESGGRAFLCLSVPELNRPPEIDEKTWKRIRRAYLNMWQPANDWGGEKTSMVLANNVLSDPASVSLWYYSAPMHFLREPLDGIDVTVLLRHSLDFYVNNYCSPIGHMIGFGMHDLYVFTNAAFLISVWDYFKLTSDFEWLRKNIEKLNNVANYLIRRDVDGDGIIESYGSGNRGTLRDPDRADVWWEMVNLNWKNSYLNVLSYRAFLCFSEILEACGYKKGAARFKEAAGKIKARFFELFYNPKTGLIASWISLDGEVHDYAYTPINGMAVAYGLVPSENAKDVMLKALDLMKKIGFDSFHLGVPLNLIPVHPSDRIQPALNPDGEDTGWGLLNIISGGEDGSADMGKRIYNGSTSSAQTWHFLLGLQRAGLTDEADKILNAMIETAYGGGFQNGIVNIGYAGAEHLNWDGTTCGYEGYLAEMWVFLTAAFTKNPDSMKKMLGPVA